MTGEFLVAGIRRISLLAIALLSLMLLSSLAYAAVPRLLSVQGKLTDTNDVALSGTYNFTFRIYNAASGGSQLYWENQSLTATNGLVSVLVGAVNILTLPFDTGYWISFEVNSTGEMTPRQQLASSGYAFRANITDYIAAGAKGEGNLTIGSNALHVDTSNTRVGIALTNPTQALDVSGTVKATAFQGDGSALTGITSIPSSFVGFFNLTSCPTGWTEDTKVRGRVIVGLPASGTLEGTVGTALLNLSPRNITDVPAHTHAVDPPSTGVSITDLAHGHSGVVGFATGGNGGAWRITGDNPGGNTPPSNSPTATTGISASVDIASFTSGSTGVASVDVTMPFIQYLVCVKN